MPVAAGLGGGSADAAAALRALAAENGLAADDDRSGRRRAPIGADVPVCLSPRARVMAGLGERLGPPLDPPPLFAVLANPGIAVATPAVFAGSAWRAARRPARLPGREIGRRSTGRASSPRCAAAATICRRARSTIAPAIAEALRRAVGAPRARRLARMSGSGATCFALYDDRRLAARARARRCGARDRALVGAGDRSCAEDASPRLACARASAAL